MATKKEDEAKTASDKAGESQAQTDGTVREALAQIDPVAIVREEVELALRTKVRRRVHRHLNSVLKGRDAAARLEEGRTVGTGGGLNAQKLKAKAGETRARVGEGIGSADLDALIADAVSTALR